MSNCLCNRLLNRQEELEFWWEFIFRVEPVGKVDSSDATISVNLHSEGFYIVGAICASGKIGQVELNLIPAFVQSHRHSANEWLYSRRRLVVTCSESSSYVLIIQDLRKQKNPISFPINFKSECSTNLYFECEIFFLVLDNHYQER